MNAIPTETTPVQQVDPALAHRFSDSLTGLPNRKRFIAQIDRLIDERRADPAPFAVAVIDLNDFRPINDVFGADAGDEILAQAGFRLRNAGGQAFTAARVGGDVFGLLMPGTFNEDGARELVGLLCDLLAAPFDIGERSVQLANSAGVALYHDLSTDGKALLHNAESALYNAKRRGGAPIQVHCREMEQEAKRLIRIEQALRQAIANRAVDVHFQPIICFANKRLAGFECLARWTDADLGTIRPDIFIDLAERRGLIAPLSRVLLEKALAALKHWPDEIFIAFNLSPSQLSDAGTTTMITELLERFEISPNRLEIEITESAVVANPSMAARIIEQFKTLGMRLSLDDFGTGQSSLGRIRELPFNKLKIDRSFVMSLLDDKASETIVRAILAMCSGLGIKVVAEGIEECEQAARLIQMGCDGGQGYLFGRPQNAETTSQFIETNRKFVGA